MNFEKLFGPVQTNAIYFYLAKIALWMTSIVLLGVFVWALRRILNGDPTVAGNLISSAQVLSFIAISVMGYHLSGRRGQARNLRNGVVAGDTVEDALETAT